MGRHDQAIAEVKRAQELDPLSPLLYGIAEEILQFARRYDECIDEGRKGLELDPNHVLVHGNLAGCLLGKGMPKEAAAEYLKAYLPNQMGDPSNMQLLALSYALNGQTTKAVEVLKELKVSWGQGGRSSTLDAQLCLMANLCTKQETLDWLEKAFEARDADAPLWNVHPAFDLVRSEPRFQDIMRRMNFPK